MLWDVAARGWMVTRAQNEALITVSLLVSFVDCIWRHS